MRKKTKLIITMACLALACAGLAACAQETELDALEREGNVISVTYDPNDGLFENRTGRSIVNMFNPDNFKDTDGDGKIDISLKSLDPALTDVGAPTKSGYSFAGWFKTRELATNAAGEPIDDYGNVLEIGKSGLLYIKGTNTRATQAYNYADMWDFEKDKIEYAPGSGTYKLTLYAAWVPYYKFDYYYQDNGEWKKFGSTDFDYSATQSFLENYAYTSAVTQTFDCDKVWTPKWSGENDTGEMLRTHGYSDNKTTYTFPNLDAHTFDSAYTDEACKNPIDGEISHGGSLVYNESTKKLEINGFVQNIYVKFNEGEQYRVTSAEDFVKFAGRGHASCVYTIMENELDFTGKAWPSALTSGEFDGKIIGNNAVFKNITATNGDASLTFGGLFGKLTADASIENITFDNATYDMATGSSAMLADNVYAYFGLFAGEIEAGAVVKGIAVTHSTLKIGRLARNNYSINLTCGSGANTNVAYSGISIVLTGTEARVDGETKYRYFVTDISVNEQTGAVTPTIVLSSQGAIVRDTESFLAYPSENK